MLYEYGKLQFSFGAYEPAALYLANYRVLVCTMIASCISMAVACVYLYSGCFVLVCVFLWR